MSRPTSPAGFPTVTIFVLSLQLAVASSTLAHDPTCRSQSTKRLALVIGNSYSGTLNVSGAKDAEVMADHLCQLGFSLPKPLIDADFSEMSAAIDQFRADIEAAEAIEDIVFFFSGHGYQIGEKNYLLPVGKDINPANPQMPLDDVTWALNGAPEAANKIVFIDACRTSAGLRIEGGGSLGNVDGWKNGMKKPATRPSNTLFSFAAGYGQVAASGEVDELSPFSELLTQSIREPGLEIRELLSRVKRDLRGIQVPASEGLSGIRLPFYFKEPIPLKLRVNQADDELLVVHNGELAFSMSASKVAGNRSEGAVAAEQPKPRVDNEKILLLNGGLNQVVFLVSNGRTYKSGQSWRVPEGWSYDVEVAWPEAAAEGARREAFLRRFECEGRDRGNCLRDYEETPFKDGPHHGKVFQVAIADIDVDSQDWGLTVKIRPRVWERQAGIHAKSQRRLWRRSINALPLEKSDRLTNLMRLVNAFTELLAFLGMTGEISLPDTARIFAEVHGNVAFDPWVRHCMDERMDDRIKDLEVSVRAALQNTEIRPFDSFDKALSDCVWKEARKQTDNPYGEDDVKVWTAIEDDS